MDLYSEDSSGGSFDVDLLDFNLAAAVDGLGEAPPAPDGFGFVVPSQGMAPIKTTDPSALVGSYCGAPPSSGYWPASATHHSSVDVRASLPLSRGPVLPQFSGPRMSVPRPLPRVEDLLARRAALDQALSAMVSLLFFVPFA